MPFHGKEARAALETHVAIQTALTERNRAGGIDGWRLELVSLDHQDDPALAAIRIDELIVDPGIVAILASPIGVDAAATRTIAARPIAGPLDARDTLDALLSEIEGVLPTAGRSPTDIRARLRRS
jgi:ABC-type branched-subunit amino acid transport system substrate-binding protein